MNVGFFIAGGVIFSIYIALTLWNIYDSSKKSKATNYPDLDKKP